MDFIKMQDLCVQVCTVCIKWIKTNWFINPFDKTIVCENKT